MDGLRSARGWAPALLCAIAILLAYSRVRDAGFIWDDDAHVTANPTIVGPQGLKEIWTSAKANYFPLTMTSFWVLHAFAGLSPAPYHVVTVLFHAATALMLWLVLRELRVPGAWLGAMLWALHPVQVESVAWISELKNTQSGFFFLIAIWFFIRWLGADPVPRLRRDYVLALMAAMLAVLSKSSTVMLPVIMGLVAWWTGKRRWQDAVWLAPFFAISLAASGWTIWEQKVASMASGSEWNHGLAARFAIAGKVAWFYLAKLLWPEPLVFIYPRWDVNDLGPVAWLPLAAAGLVGWWLWRNREGRGRPLFLGLGYFTVSLFPVLGFFDVFFFRYSFVGDHLQYLASMGPLALLGAGVTAAMHRITSALRWHRAGAAVLLGISGALTWQQTRIYRSNHALWQDTVARNPHAWIARVNWGVELVAAGRPAEALPHYEAALRLKPHFKEVGVNLGAVLVLLGRAAEAIPHFETALQGTHVHAHAHNGLGLALFQTGRTAEAIRHYEAALRLEPGFDVARCNLGNALVQARRLPEALEHYDKIVRAVPSLAMYRNALARTLVALGRVPEAIEHYRAAAEMTPADFEAQSTLAAMLSRAGVMPEALARAEAALRLRPDSAEVHYHAGAALASAGRAQEALRYYEQAVRLRPDYFEARMHLATTLYRIGHPADALPHYEALVQAQPQSSDAHNNLASTLVHAGRLPEAIQHYETAVRLQPDNPEMRTNFALALAAAGRLGEALEECREALRVGPDYPPARQTLEKIEAAQRARETPK